MNQPPENKSGRFSIGHHIPPEISNTLKHKPKNPTFITIFIARFVTFFLIGFYLLNFDPFGLETITDNLNRDIYQMVRAPWYQTRNTDTSPTVILLDDRSLENMGEDWPLHYGTYGRIMGNIIQSCPAALMVDFEFVRTTEQDEIAAMAAELELAYEALDPVDCPSMYDPGRILFAASGNRTDDSLFDFLAGRGHTVPISWKFNAGLYPGQAMLPGGAEHATPAFDVYRQLNKPAAGNSLPRLEPAPQLSIQWPLNDPNSQIALYDKADSPACWTPNKTALGKVANSLAIAFYGISERAKVNDATPLQPCYPIRTLMAYWLYFHELNAPTTAQVLTGKPVFFGANLRATPDLVLTPLHGNIPGVFYHAIAYENLNSMGWDYIKEDTDITAWLELIIWCFIALIMACWRSTEKTEPAAPASSRPPAPWEINNEIQREKRKLPKLLIETCIVLFMYCLAIVASEALGIQLSNFIGILASLGISAFVQGSGIIIVLYLALYYPIKMIEFFYRRH